MSGAGRRLVALVLLAAAGALWFPGPARADDTQVGWWYRYTGPSAAGASAPAAADGEPRMAGAQAPTTLPPTPLPAPTVPLPVDPPGAPAPVPPPAQVPEGGLYVANDLAGPVAVSGLRFASGAVGETTLTLRFADNANVGTAAVTILACPLSEGFQPVANGAWVDRPEGRCSESFSTGSVDSTQTTMSWTLAPGFQPAGETVLDVLLRPAPGDATVFQVAFAPPASDALRVLGPPVPRPTAPPPTAFRPDPAAPAAAFNTPAAGAARPGGVASGPIAAAPAGSTGSATETGGSPTAPIAGVFDDREWARWVATALLAAMAGGLLVTSRYGGARADHRGIGRFARARTGIPPAVS